MDTLSDTSRVLLSRLPEIHDLHELIDLSLYAYPCVALCC